MRLLSGEPLEVISEDDWLHTDVGRDYNVHLVKELLHCFSIGIEITGDNCYCFIFKNIESCKEKFQRVNKL